MPIGCTGTVEFVSCEDPWRQGGTYVGVLKVSVVRLTILLALLLLLLECQTIICLLRISLLVSSDQNKAPGQNERKLKPEANCTSDGARGVLRGVLLLEDLTSDHVANAVSNEGETASDGTLGATGGVAWNECPGKEKAKHEGHRDEVATPLGPLDGGVVGEERHAQESCKGREDGAGHEEHSKIGPLAAGQADADEDDY